MTVSIQKADSSQIDLIRKLASEIWPGTYHNILSAAQIEYMMELIYSESALKNQIENKHDQFIIVYDDEKPVGFASFSRKDGRTFKLHKIYVHQKMQGKGIGKQIIDYVIHEILKENAEQLDLDVNRHNPARSFYEKLGFYILKEQDTDIGNGYFMNDYVMRKRINSSK
jgi:ribosomal protein S18 acetylase RimI-like enzyme